LAGVRAAALALALALALLFAAGLRAADARRAAVADLRAASFRSEALVAFGLRDAAARFAFPGFLDFVAFAMIDLPILWANSSTLPHFWHVPTTIPDSPQAAKHCKQRFKHTNSFFYFTASVASVVVGFA
jgi:hypothetical protein